MYSGIMLWDMMNANTINTSIDPILHRSCPHCSNGVSRTYHVGQPCPYIRSIEYDCFGSVKKIEFWPGEEDG